jgi:hypothetical protein
MTTTLGGRVHGHDAPMPIDVRAAHLRSALGVAGAQRRPTAPDLQGAG